MAEISLRIHSQDSEVHEIFAPDDIIAAELITQVLEGLGLSQVDSDGRPILWEVDDKDTGRKLIRAATLLENGVFAGHNLYLRRTVITVGTPGTAGKGDPDPVNHGKPGPPLPPPKSPAWPLWAALALIPLAGIAGYFGAQNRTEANIRAELRDKQVRIDNANKTYVGAEAHSKQLEDELERLKHDATEKDAGSSKLQADVASKDSLIAAKDKRVSQLTTQVSQLQVELAEKTREMKELEGSAQKLQQAQSQVVSLQQGLASERQKSQSLQQTAANLQLQVQSERNHPRFGLIVWTGNAGKSIVDINGGQANIGSVVGSLPGTECKVQAADPTHVTISGLPTVGNRWNHIAFTVKGKDTTSVTLIWTTN